MLCMHQCLVQTWFFVMGGVGGIAKTLANGLINKGSKLLYKHSAYRLKIYWSEAIRWKRVLHQNSDIKCYKIGYIWKIVKS
ncbi:hypothetical protein IEQ34_009012 [Dendrobium chrysotoxum]|uniref:Uncharacterized protein n=1 Tax=Dendrobium chrysotoxum TaxID=161865 RepID=A0AAV7GZF4_DENCH|nr:hypothetical protein IEQ34_009012 [Dendrobium chrysotoxum]